MTSIAIVVSAQQGDQVISRREIATVGSEAEANVAVRDAAAFSRRPTNAEARMSSDLDVYRSARRRLVGSCLAVIAAIVRQSQPDATAITVMFADDEAPRLLGVSIEDGIDQDVGVLSPAPRADLLEQPLALLQEAADTNRLGAAMFRLPPSPNDRES